MSIQSFAGFSKIFFALLGVLLAVSCRDPQAPPQPKPAPPPFEFLGVWGARGDRPGELSQPIALTTDRLGNVYVADASTRSVSKFDSAGHPRLSFQLSQRPSSIAVDLGGAIYVGSDKPPAVTIFFPDGELIRELRSGSARRLQKPAGVAVDEDGNIFVADAACECIQKLDPRGRSLKTWGQKGKGNSEFDGVGGLAVGGDGNLYVLDAANHRVQKFSREGDFLAAWGGDAAEASSLENIASITVSDKFVFLGDPKNRAIQVWSLDGVHRWTESLASHIEIQSGSPVSISITPRNELYLLDGPGARVLRFRVNF